MIYKKWKVLPPAPQEFLKKFPHHQKTILNLLYHRIPHEEKSLEEFFNPSYDLHVHDPFLFRDMKKAVERISRALQKKEKIAIFGDYDVDGITSATIISEVLQKTGAKPIVYLPDRKHEGYSLNLAALRYLKEKGTKLLITVDCGIRDTEEVEKANKWGMDVIITDHHLPGEKIPKAFCVINPQVKNERYPFQDLAGVGVAFKLASAVVKSYQKEFFTEGYEKWFLDLVALGTIADMVPLVGENRTLVKYGLIVLSKTRRKGIKTLFKTSRVPLDEKTIPSSNQISFQIAPRLNAAGRMDHANTSFELLNTKSDKKAEELSRDLEEKNGRRQRLTDKIVKEIENRLDLQKKLVFEGKEDWPMGILGLVAGKICDKYARPTFVFNVGKERCRGSIRSFGKFKVVESLEECKNLLLDYGGHDHAGGFSFKKENWEKLKRKLERIANRILEKEDLALEVNIDQRLSLSDINWKLEEVLKSMEPFGVGNSTPLFLSEGVELFQCNVVGNGKKHLKMWFKENGKIFESIAFGKGEKHCSLIAQEKTKVDIVYEIGSDQWNGEKKIQLYVKDLRLTPKREKE